MAVVTVAPLAELLLQCYEHSRLRIVAVAVAVAFHADQPGGVSRTRPPIASRDQRLVALELGPTYVAASLLSICIDRV